jgi:hypothetical protein
VEDALEQRLSEFAQVSHADDADRKLSRLI